MLSALAVGCAERSVQPGRDGGASQVEADADVTLEGAAVFECESGETIQVPEKKKVKFKPGKELKDMVEKA